MKKELFRKALSGLLGLGMAAAVALTSAAPVMAAEGGSEGGSTSTPAYSFNKVYEWESAYSTGASSSGSPAETFSFGTAVSGSTENGTASLTKVEESSYTSTASVPSAAQTITIGSAVFAAGDAGQHTVMTKAVPLTIPAASDYAAPGKYTYSFTERQGDTAGVQYDSTSYEIVVVVIQGTSALEIQSVKLHRASDSAKGQNIANKYQSGRLTITKKVTGTMGDRNKSFPIRVTLTKPTDKVVRSTIQVKATNSPEGAAVSNIEASAWNSDNTITITYQLKNDTQIVLSNIPAGVNYSVEEDRTNITDYTTTYKKGSDPYVANTSVSVNGSTDDTITITNDKGGGNDTGLFLNNLPYILIIAAIGVGAAAYVVVKVRKRNA